MFLLLSSATSLVISILALVILLRARSKLKAKSINLLAGTDASLAFASVMSIFGTISSTKDTALNHFIISLEGYIVALLIGLMFIELIRTGRSITSLSTIGAIIFGYLLMEPLISKESLIERLVKVGSYWERSSLRGIYGRVMIIIFMAIILIDFLIVSKLYLSKTKTPKKRKMTYLFTLAIFILALPYLTISPFSFIYPNLKITIVPLQFIFSALGWLLLAIIVAINPYFANLLTQTIQAFLLIRENDGTLIYSKIFVEAMKEKESLFASFLTATASAMSEVIEVGAMKKIFFEKIVLNFAVGEVTYAALLTDRESSIIDPVLNELLQEIERSIPKDELLSPATEDRTLKNIDNIVDRILYPLLP